MPSLKLAVFAASLVHAEGAAQRDTPREETPAVVSGVTRRAIQLATSSIQHKHIKKLRDKSNTGVQKMNLGAKIFLPVFC